jgi:condensin-2 complex subunit H2
MEDEESIVTSERWAHLLKPIRYRDRWRTELGRDLAENWNIDIATDLQDYLEELHKVTYSVGGVQKLKFAEGGYLYTAVAEV